jgi:hypothetical protein
MMAPGTAFHNMKRPGARLKIQHRWADPLPPTHPCLTIGFPLVAHSVHDPSYSEP